MAGTALKLITAMTGLLVAACASTVPAVRVTDASLGVPIPKAEVVIEPNAPSPANSPQFLAAASAVGAELTRAGFRVAPASSVASPLIAVVDYTRVIKPSSWFGRTFGGSTAGNRDSSAKPASYIQTTTLAVRLRRRSDQSIIWQGRSSLDTRVAASTAASAEEPVPLAPQLAAAVFKGLNADASDKK